MTVADADARSQIDQLMLSAGAGDEAAFRRFYDQVAPAVLAFLLKMLRDRHEAEDVLQESMVIAWNRAGDFDPHLASAKTWITTIARRRALDVLRRRKRHTQTLETEADDIRRVLGSDNVDTQGEPVSEATAARLSHCFGEIGAEAATCIRYAYIYGLTYPEIASYLDRALGHRKELDLARSAKSQGVYGTMNYLRPEILEPLTGRYVLGTMSRRARRRFDRLFDEHTEVQASVYRLEDLLLPTLWELPKVRPSELVWRRIARDLGFGVHKPRRNGAVRRGRFLPPHWVSPRSLARSAGGERLTSRPKPSSKPWYRPRR